MPLDFSDGEWLVRVGTAKASSVTLSPFRPGEAADLGDAFARIDPWARYPYPAEALARYLATDETGAPRRAVRQGGMLAGALGLRLNWLRGPYVQFLGLLPEAQGSGLGSAVLAALAAAAAEAGERNLWVCVSDFNVEGMKFYERQGFVRVATLDGLVRDGKSELLLRKTLSIAA